MDTMLNQQKETKKRLKSRYNDSLSKYKHNLSIKQINKPEIQLKTKTSGLTDNSIDLNKKEILSNYHPGKMYDWTNKPRASLSVPKYHILRAKTPKRDYNYLRRKDFTYTPKKFVDSIYFKTTENFSQFSETERNNNNYTVHIPYKEKYYSRRHIRPNLSPKKIDNSTTSRKLGVNNNGYTNTYDSSRNKELINLNNILQKQNKDLRLKTREMRYNINELLNNIKLMRMENQRINNEKKKLLMTINNLEKDLEQNKNLSFNELESKNNEITQLNEELIKLNSILDEKENEIMNLKINNGLNNQINNFNNLNYNENINTNNINDFIQQINKLKKENQILRKERDEALQNNLNINKDLINNNNNIEANNEKINTLMYENQKYQKSYQILKKEYEKMRNYLAHIKGQKVSFDNQQKEYQNNLNNLHQKINVLSNENNQLKNKITEYESNLQLNNQNENNMNTQLLMQLKEENDILREQINQDKNNDVLEINYLKKEIENKNKEINNSQEIITELKNDLNLQKNKAEDMSKNYLDIKEEDKQLKIKMNELEKQIDQLKNINIKLSSKINSSNNGDSIHLNQSKNQNNEIVQQITILKQKNDELQKSLMDSLNNETSYNNKINIILQEKNSLIQENSELKNKISKLQNNISELENESHTKIAELENQLKQARKECKINLMELKEKENQTQNLLELIKNKELENEQLKNEMENYGGEAEKNIDLDNNINIGINKHIEELKNEIEEKNAQINKLEKEIDNDKAINNRILQENTQLKEKLQLIQSGENEGYIITIDNLKDELKDKNLQIQKLIEQNNNIRNTMKNNNLRKEEDEKEIDLNNNKNEYCPFRPTINSTGLSDADKIKLYKEQINEYKITNESDKIQIKTLKEDIKIMKAKIKNLETFGGQMKDLNEFISLLNQALLNYKPKKKEQKDALNRIINVLNNHQI